LSESTCSPARRILDCCVRGEPWSPADLRALIDAGSPELYTVLAEGLSDRFERRLVDAYVRIFTGVLGADPARYERIRRPRRCTRDYSDVYVLSRVTLGADVAITSVVLDAAKRRFPKARITFVGDIKSYELFAADPRIAHLPVRYTRERPTACPWLSGLVIDPDSRLTQLGLVPVCPEEDYLFFESRSHGEDSADSLACLAQRWVAGTFGISDARPYVALDAVNYSPTPVAVSFGVGANPAKRLPDPFEAELLRALAQRFDRVILDTGAGGEEAERAGRAVEACGRPDSIRLWEGSFSSFAQVIAGSRLYVGYDSAGQHVAAACGVPLVSIFAGFPCDRFLHRWRPTGPGPCEVVTDASRAIEAIDRLAG
jgi:hypothetical protein